MINIKNIIAFVTLFGLVMLFMVFGLWFLDITFIREGFRLRATHTANALIVTGLLCLYVFRYEQRLSKPIPDKAVYLGFVVIMVLLASTQPILDIWAIAVDVSKTTSRAASDAVISLVCLYALISINNKLYIRFPWYRRLVSLDPVDKHTIDDYSKSE